MRTIKFRGKGLDNGEWIYGDLSTFDGTDCEISDWNTVDCSRYDVDPETVGQFTGLFDKNGTEIFEGDIITSDEIHTRAIEWNDYECKFNAVEWGIHKAVVLGNIHDNPELLKTK